MTDELILVDDINIEDIIYEIRGKQVMLDSDLAKLYHVETGALNRQVKRNIERFPEDFMFRLTDSEFKDLICQFGMSKKESNRGGRRTNPYVFTEHGISMLSAVLHTEIAINVSVKIIRAFIKMRRFIKSNLLEQKYINNLVLEHDKDIKLLQDTFNKLEEKEKINTIFCEGQIYDANSLLLDILNKSKK